MFIFVRIFGQFGWPNIRIRPKQKILFRLNTAVNIGQLKVSLTHGPHSEVEAAVSDPGAEQARALSVSDVGHAVRLLRVSRAPIATGILLLREGLFPEGVFGPDDGRFKRQ